MFTTQPGLQVYTANFLGPAVRSLEQPSLEYPVHSAVCLEAQNFPDAVNQPSICPSPILKEGELYQQVIRFKFSTRD